MVLSDERLREFETVATRFNAIIDRVEARCMAVDGPVTPTLDEMEEQELAELWQGVQNMRRLLSPRAAEQQEPVAAHVRFRREAVALALTMDPSDFAGDFDPVDDNTVEGFARTLTIVLGGYDWTLDDKGRLAGCVAGDHGYATTGIVVDLGAIASPQPPVPPGGPPLADWSELPRDLYVIEAKRHDIGFDVTMCSVPMVTAPEVRYVRADMLPPVPPGSGVSEEMVERAKAADLQLRQFLADDERGGELSVEDHHILVNVMDALRGCAALLNGGSHDN